MVNLKSKHSGVNTITVVGIIFVILKLTDNIDWSWWLVLLPFYGGSALFILIVISVIIFTKD